MDSPQASQEERIAARRQRVQARKNYQATHSGSHAGAAASSDAADGSTAAGPLAPRKQIELAHQAMTGAHSEAANAVSMFSVKASADEAERRDRADQQADERGTLLRDAAQTSRVKEATLGLGFEALHDHSVPHDLRDALLAQQRECAESLTLKDAVIEELKEQLESKEEDYVQLLRQNTTDLNALVEAMKMKTNEFLDEYAAQLSEVEKKYEEERREYQEKCDGEVQALIKTRRTRETDYRKRREAKIVEAQQTLEEKHEQSYEGYNTVKRGHQTENNTLQQELEKCRADFLLNGERLSYNLQVLRERVRENKTAQSQYKRKLAKLQDVLSTLVARHQDSDKRYQRSNKDLTSQLHRVVAQYKDAQEKFQIFEKADTDKYRQLWNMHDQRCQRLVHRSLQADRVVYETILNVPWNPPDLNFWPEESAQDDVEDATGNTEEEEEPEDAIELSEPAVMLLHILRDQAPFLVNQRVRDAVKKIEGTTSEQADIEGLLTTLGVRKNDDVRDLLEYFTAENDDGATVTLINPQEAVRALNVFLHDRTTAETEAKRTKAASTTSAAVQRQQQREKLLRQREQRKATQEKEYWQKLGTCVPKDHLQVWGSLEKGLEQYLAQLQQRKELITSTDTLRAQNDELKDLLAQYVRSDVNFQLYAPPALVTSLRRA